MFSSSNILHNEGAGVGGEKRPVSSAVVSGETCGEVDAAGAGICVCVDRYSRRVEAMGGEQLSRV